jgi:hypothetical protein
MGDAAESLIRESVRCVMGSGLMPRQAELDVQPYLRVIVRTYEQWWQLIAGVWANAIAVVDVV